MKVLISLSLLFGFVGIFLLFFPAVRFSALICLAAALFFLVLYLLLHSHKVWAKYLSGILSALALAGMIAASITGTLVYRAAHPQPAPDLPYILVLGAGVNGTVPSLSLTERIQAACAYLQAHPDTTAVLCGGQGSGEDITEAACMYRELTQQGIEGSRLLLEDCSTNTFGNLSMAKKIIQQQEKKLPASIGIVSSEYHLCRAQAFARSLGMKAVGIPATTGLLPLRLNYYLREIAALWKFWLIGP